jgi:hypothetical protein
VALASVSVVIVDVEDGNWNTLSTLSPRTQTLQKSRSDGYIVYEAISTAERSPRVMTGWAAASGASLNTRVAVGNTKLG